MLLRFKNNVLLARSCREEGVEKRHFLPQIPFVLPHASFLFFSLPETERERGKDQQNSS